MDPELKRLLEENLATAKDTRRMTKKLLSYRRWEAMYGVVKFIVVIGVLIWTYQYLEPYLEQLLAVYTQMNGVFQNLPLPGGN